MTTPSVNSAISGTAARDHVLLFPFLSKGHTIPLLHLATALSSRNILVTFITTPAIVPFVRHHISSSSSSSNISILALPFPSHPDIPDGVETTDALPSLSLLPAFFAATTSTSLRDSFHLLLSRLLRTEAPPLCLVSDFFLGWTLPICRRFGLPRLVFHGMSVFSMSICKFLWNNAAALAAKEPFPVPGAPPSLRLEITDIPVEIRNSVDQLKPTTQFMKSVGETDVGSWGVIVNSFMELEPPAYVELLESFYRQAGGGRTWLVGPLNLLAGDKAKNCSETECIQWLDRQPEGSVVYIAFGTQASVSDEQLDEVASGLLQAGVRFLWVVRSDTWVASIETGDLGRMERGWVPQKEVLSHAAVGGFVSHCGWNSVLEALAAGVAVLAFPMMAEQSLNAKMVGDEIGIGLRLPAPGAGGVVGRKDVEEGVRELMGGEKGRRARKMAQEMAKKARDAAVEGGSSYLMLDKLLDELRKVPKVAAAAVAVAAGVVEGEETGEWSGKEVTCI